MSEFLPVRINTLRAESTLTFDLYINVGKRFVHYIKNGDEIEKDRLKNLKSKKVKKLYIPFDLEDAYLNYLNKGLDDLSGDDLSLDEKSAMANDALVTQAENAEKSFETEEGFNLTKESFTKVADFLMSDQGAIKKILASAGQSLDNHQHAATVCSLCCAIATREGSLDSETIFELGIAALVHDIGKNSLSFDPLMKTTEMTPEQKKEYRKHPAAASDALAGKPFISPRILGLINSHEEIGAGIGYPEKKNYFKLKTPYRILNLCNDFDRYSYENNLSHQEALDQYYEARGEHIDESLFTILASVLN